MSATAGVFGGKSADEAVIIIQIDCWFCREQDRWLMKRQERREGSDYYYSESLEANHNIHSAEQMEQVEVGL